MAIPKQFTDLVGKRKILQGGIFSRNKSIEPQEYDILDIRSSMATIMNVKSRKRYMAFELLIKNENMPKARWTNPFPIRDK